MRRPELVAYVPLAVATTATGVMRRLDLQRWVKPLLVPTLLAGSAYRRRLRPSLAVAGAAATAGDWFMLEQGRCPDTEVHGPQSTRMLRLGAASFGVQQLCYIGMLVRRGARPQLWPALTAVGVLGCLAVSDTSERGGLDPVLFGYGLSLGTMAALAQSLSDNDIRVGGALFLASDAMIIIGERTAGTRFQPLIEAFVMTTYTAAQALLIGALED